MTPEQLKNRIGDALNLSQATLEIWCYALEYIYENGWADVADDVFVKEGKIRFRISSQSLIRHLRRMAKNGFLVGHRLSERPNELGRVIFHHTTPRSFIRYTLPGTHAQMEEIRKGAPSSRRRGHDLTAKEKRY